MQGDECPLQWALPNERLRDVTTTLPTDEVDWITPTGSRQRHRLLSERESGYYERVYRERKNQNVIAILTRTGQTVEQALALTCHGKGGCNNEKCDKYIDYLVAY
jgi:hypothetical protein